MCKLYGEYMDFMISIIDMGVAEDYSLLLSELNKRTFIPSTPLDRNRELDGYELRRDFEFICNDHIPGKCTFLEMMVALSVRITNDVMGDDPGKWFWLMIDNLGMLTYTDEAFGDWHTSDVETAVFTINARKWDKKGNGSLFPLSTKSVDQRKLDIWMQAQRYLAENYY